MALVNFQDLPNTTTPINANNLNNNFNELDTRTTALETTLFTTMWTGDLVPTALNTNTNIEFASTDLRPTRFALCFVHINIDGTHIYIPFTSAGYGVSRTCCGRWGVSNSTYANFTITYGGYNTASVQVKDIANKTISQVHILSVIGIK